MRFGELFGVLLSLIFVSMKYSSNVVSHVVWFTVFFFRSSLWTSIEGTCVGSPPS